MNAREAADIAKLPYRRALALLWLGVLPGDRSSARWKVAVDHLPEWRAAAYGWRERRKEGTPRIIH